LSNNSDVESFVIIDDEPNLFRNLLDRLIKTSNVKDNETLKNMDDCFGFCEHHIEKAKKMLKSKFRTPIVLCEKFGFFGGALVLIALAVIVIRTIYIGLRVSDNTGRLICSGVAAIFILQTLENIGMCLALIPVVGITLPFMSAGGSSMLALYVIMGLVHSVRARERRLNFGRGL
jgi:hypothetical protein